MPAPPNNTATKSFHHLMPAPAGCTAPPHQRRNRPPPTTRWPVSFPAQRLHPDSAAGCRFSFGREILPQGRGNAPEGRLRPKLCIPHPVGKATTAANLTAMPASADHEVDGFVSGIRQSPGPLDQRQPSHSRRNAPVKRRMSLALHCSGRDPNNPMLPL